MKIPSTKDDYRLAKAGCPQAFRRLLNDWQAWTSQNTHYIRHYSKESAQLLSQEELDQEALHLFYKAINQLNLKFTTEQCTAYIKTTVKFGLKHYAEKSLGQALQCQPERLDFFLEVRSFWESLSHLDSLIAQERHQQVKNVIRRYCTPQERLYLAKRFGLKEIVDDSLDNEVNATKDVQSIKALAEGIGISYQALRSREKSLFKRLRSFFLRHHGID